MITFKVKEGKNFCNAVNILNEKEDIDDLMKVTSIVINERNRKSAYTKVNSGETGGCKKIKLLNGN